MTADVLYTRKTLAAYLSCCVRTIDNMVARGMPISMHVGDSPRFRLADVEPWLATNRPSRSSEPLSFAEARELGEAIREFPDPNRVEDGRH